MKKRPRIAGPLSCDAFKKELYLPAGFCLRQLVPNVFRQVIGRWGQGVVVGEIHNERMSAHRVVADAVQVRQYRGQFRSGADSRNMPAYRTIYSHVFPLESR